MKKVELPRTSERIQGFTLPESGEFFVADYDEVFRITLGEAARADVLDANPYDFMRSRKDFFGVLENTPILEVGDSKVAYKFSPRAQHQTVSLKCRGQSHSIQFRTMSGDWFVASLSRDGAFLAVAEPYLLELYDLR